MNAPVWLSPRRIAAFGVAALVLGVLAFVGFRLATSAPPDGYGVERSAELKQDCELCPALLSIPAGTYAMGWDPRLVKQLVSSSVPPNYLVTFQKPFALGVYEVTFREWEACLADGGCGGRPPDDHGWGRGEQPVVDVSFDDVQGYLRWLSAKTGQRYRLPTEAEWEYAARAGTTTPFPWGRWPSHDYANYGQDKCCVGKVEGADQWQETAPVGRFPANRFGLHDMIGNVYEWVQDCYAFEPQRNTEALVQAPDCKHVIRGGAWYSDAVRVHSGYRAWQTHDRRDKVIGFRVARDL